MRRIDRIALTATIAGLIVMAGGFGVSHAQRQARKADRYEITAQLSEAMRYMSSDPERALAILQSLNRKFPGQDRVLTRLGRVHLVIGAADSAEVYYSRALKANPQSIEAARSLGSLFITQDKEAAAMDVFHRLIVSTDHSVSAYKAAGSTLRDLGKYDKALEIYDQGRQRGPRYYMLLMEIAEVHRSMFEYDAALDDYLEYVGARARNYRFTRPEMLELLREAGDERERLVASLKAKLEAGTEYRYVILDLLAANYLEQGLLESALEMALAADKEQSSDGEVLLQLADQIMLQVEVRSRDEKRRYYELGVRALDAYTSSHPRAPGLAKSKYLLAKMYVELAQPSLPGRVTAAERRAYLDNAVAKFTELSRIHANSEYGERANLDKGDLLLYALKKPEAALEAYKVGAVNSQRLGDVFGARIGRVYLGLGRFDEAATYFAELTNSGVPELMQTGMYYTGLLNAFKGDYEAARDHLTGMAEGDPSSPFTNDAIETAWVVEEGRGGDPDVLAGYMNAMQAEMIGDTTRVISELKKIVGGSEFEPMRPRAMFKLGSVQYEAGMIDAAVQTLRKFLDEYPDSGMRPDVQREIARIYEHGFEKYDLALQTYEEVLLNYPDYAFLDEVRKDVRRLRFIVNGEE